MTKSVAKLLVDETPICTASVVTKSGWIMTAQHCLTRLNALDSWNRVSIELWSAGVGVTGSQKHTATVKSPPVSMKEAQSPNFASYRDVSLLFVGALPSWSEPIPMATAWPALGTTLTQFGYGTSSLSDETPSPILIKSPNGAISRAHCPAARTWDFGNICTTTKSTKGLAFPGDSGGPLLWWTGGGWRQVGVFTIYPVRQINGEVVSDLTEDARWRGFWAPMDTATATWIATTTATSPTKSAPAPAPPPAQATYAEQQGSRGANTFSNPYNAFGMGPRVPAGQWVQISCKTNDTVITSVFPDGYWYRIASAPWNNQYYAAANTFMNGDPWGGPYSRYTDWAVPNC